MTTFWSYCILESKPLSERPLIMIIIISLITTIGFIQNTLCPLLSLQWPWFLTCWSLPFSRNLGRAPRAREKPQRTISSVFCSSETYIVTSSSRKKYNCRVKSNYHISALTYLANKKLNQKIPRTEHLENFIIH